jgi:hypothetical protein
MIQRPEDRPFSFLCLKLWQKSYATNQCITTYVSYQNFDEAGREIVSVLAGALLQDKIQIRRNHVANSIV